MRKLTETQKTIIRILFIEKESSRSLLAKKLSFSNAALTLTMKPLLRNKIVLEDKYSNHQVGRKELIVRLNPEFGYFLGVDIRIHHIYYSLMDLTGNLVDFSSDKEKTLNEFCKNRIDKILAIGVSVRGQITKDNLIERFPELHKDLEKIDKPKYLFESVESLAEVYSLNHRDDKNFLLVKYGPGIGSSIYVFGKLLTTLSEIGHIFYNEKRLEDVISYNSILGKEIEEAEANKIIYNDENKVAYILHIIAEALLNCDSLLSLQKIVLSGFLLSKEEIKEKLVKEIKLLDDKFDSDKLCVYPDYEETNNKKSSICAFVRYFREFY